MKPDLHLKSRPVTTTSPAPHTPEQLQQSIALHLGGAFFVVFLASFILAGLLAFQLYSRLIESTIDEYGNAVARQLALSSVDAVVRSDLVSLHAQLEKLVANQTVIDAAVYDMENRVLAQAGLTPNARRDIPESAIRHFPATLSFQDSLAGKVIVSLNTTRAYEQRRLLLVYFILSCVAAAVLISVLSMMLARRVVAKYQYSVAQVNQILQASPMLTPFEHTLPNQRAVEQALQQIAVHLTQLEQRNPAPKFVHSGKFQAKPTEGSYAELIIECINLDLLQQQLHPRELQKRLDTFQDHLQKTIPLYHATLVPAAGNHVLLRFPVNDVNDAALQAICAATVMIGLQREQPHADTLNIMLDFRYAVHWHEHHERPLPELLNNQRLKTEMLECHELCRRGKPGDIVVTKAIKQSQQVAEHVKLELISGDSDHDYYRVQRISDNYSRLLEQQVRQLLAASNC